MLTLTTVFLTIIAVIAIGAAVYFGRIWMNRRNQVSDSGTQIDTPETVEERYQQLKQTSPGAVPTDVMPDASIADKLPLLHPKQLVTITGEGQKRVLCGTWLEEMTQDKGAKSSDPWYPKFRDQDSSQKAVGVLLADGTWIMRIPIAEGGRLGWYIFHYQDATGIAEFFKEGSPPDSVKGGPARQFNTQQQTGKVIFHLPDGLMPDIEWKMADLGAFVSHLNGGSAEDTELVSDSDFFSFASAVENIEAEPKRRLLFLDPRSLSGYTTAGRGGLFIGEPFDPEVEVSEII